MFNPVFSVAHGKNPELDKSKERTLAHIHDGIVANGDLAKTIDELRDLRAKDSDRYKERKMEILPNILPCGIFTHRNNSSLSAHSCVISLDFDNLDIDVRELRDSLSNINSCCLAFISPSGEGVKAFFRIATETNSGNHRDAWEALVEMVASETKLQVDDVDPGAKALSQGCLASSDPDAFINHLADAFDWEKHIADNPKPKPPKRQYVPSSTDEGARIEEAINQIPASDVSREQWLKVGMALKYENVPGGFDIWDRWSSTDVARYAPSQIQSQWKSLDGYSVSVGAIFNIAKEYGWRPPTKAQKREVAGGRFERAVETALEMENDDGEGFEAVAAAYAGLSGSEVQKQESKRQEYLARGKVKGGDISTRNFNKAVKDAGQNIEMQMDDTSETDDSKIRVYLNERDVGDKQLNPLVMEIEAHLPTLLANPGADGVYNKDELLVRIEGDSLKVQSRTMMQDWLTQRIEFWEHIKKKERWYARRVRKTTSIEDRMIESPDPQFPKINSILRHPVIVQSGACLSSRGYHAESQIFQTEDTGIDYDKIETGSDAVEKAKNFLCDNLLVDFKMTDEGKANYLAYLLTYPMRPFLGMGRVPIFVVDAPTRGVGKSMLIDIASRIWTGQATAKKAFPSGVGREDEMRKLMHSIAMESHEAVLFDNLDYDLRSPNLSLAVTAGVIGGRVLGVSKTVDAKLDTFFAITGNNVTLEGDLDRRFYKSRIETDHEKPELRNDFKHAELEEWALENRHELMIAILTLVKNWQSKGETMSTIQWGSFRRWSQVIGGILESADIPGFLQNRDSSDTDEQIAWRAFVDAWFEVCRNDPVGIAELYPVACSKSDGDGKETDEARPLDEYVYGKTEQGRRVRLGILLKSKAGRIFGNHRIVKRAVKKRAVQYALETVTDGGNPTGGEGESHGESGESRKQDSPLDSPQEESTTVRSGGHQGESGESHVEISRVREKNIYKNKDQYMVESPHETHQTHLNGDGINDSAPPGEVSLGVSLGDKVSLDSPDSPQPSPDSPQPSLDSPLDSPDSPDSPPALPVDFPVIVSVAAQLFDVDTDINFEILIDALAKNGTKINREQFLAFVDQFESSVGTVVSGLLICGGRGDYHFADPQGDKPKGGETADVQSAVESNGFDKHQIFGIDILKDMMPDGGVVDSRRQERFVNKVLGAGILHDKVSAGQWAERLLCSLANEQYPGMDISIDDDDSFVLSIENE